jgi:hypothetical protein
MPTPRLSRSQPMTKLKRGRIYKRPAEVPEPDLEQPPDPQPMSLRWQLADWMQPPSRAIDGGQLVLLSQKVARFSVCG